MTIILVTAVLSIDANKKNRRLTPNQSKPTFAINQSKLLVTTKKGQPTLTSQIKLIRLAQSYVIWFEIKASNLISRFIPTSTT